MPLKELSKFSLVTMNKSHNFFTYYFLICGKLLFLISSLTGCLDLAGSCETEISRRVFNPNNTIQAITIVTDCGATTSPAYGVRLVENSDTTDEGIRGNTILNSSNGVGIKWISNDTLSITSADTTKGFTIKTRIKLNKVHTEVIIIYKDFPESGQ